MRPGREAADCDTQLAISGSFLALGLQVTFPRILIP